ncbi:uncharacterized protein [Choristoneura fumiferana]|uniref:uncharacterized protein n=1 Tax=Choristoneura fumiferana TaxID=7141 RepID=UPI003D15571B
MEEGTDPWAAHATVYPLCDFLKKKWGTALIMKHQIKDSGLKISDLLRYCRAAGMSFDYTKLAKGCVTYKDRTDRLLALLREAGLEGKPNMTKCKALRTRRNIEEEHKHNKERCRQERDQNRPEREQCEQQKKYCEQEKDQRGQEKEQRGREREQRGPESEQRGQERDQCEPEREQRGQERVGRGQEREDRVQEKEQRKSEKERRGQEREQREHEREDRKQEKEQRKSEREQRGQEREQRGQEREQRGRKQEDREQEKEQREPEREQRGKEREQREPERGQRGQEREQHGPERDQRRQERELRGHGTEQCEPKKEQGRQKNQANTVKKFRAKPKLGAHCVPIDDSILLHDIIKIARSCDETTYKPFLNIIANLAHSPGKKRQAETKKVPAKKTKMCCDECGKIYSSKHFLQKHISGHQQSCEECGKTFNTQSSLSKHRKSCGKGRASGNKSGCAQCKCGEIFAFVSSLEDHQRTCGKEARKETVSDGVAKPQRWCSENGTYSNANREESQKKAQSQETSAAQRVGIQGSGNKYEVHCKLCFADGPLDFEKHYFNEHNVCDPSSMLCNDRSFFIPSAEKHPDDDWFCFQLAKALERYTDNICRLCDKEQSDLVKHYVGYHKVDRDLLYYTKRLMREHGVVVEGAETNQKD